MQSQPVVPAPRPSGVAIVDRFARLRGEDSLAEPSPDDSETFSLASGTVLAAGAALAEDDDEAGEG